MFFLKFSILVGLLLTGGLILNLSFQKRTSLKVPEKEALQNLMKIYEASWKWRNTDIDSNAQKDFWTRDVAALYFYKKSNGKPVKLIPKELALADLKPHSHLYRDRSFKFASHRGYGFKMIQYGPIGYYYAIEDPSTKLRSVNKKSFGIMAYPKLKDSTLKTFIINEKRLVYSKIINELKSADKWPSNPEIEGWKSVKIINPDGN